MAQHSLMASSVLVHEIVELFFLSLLYLYFPPYSVHYLVLLPLPVSPSLQSFPGPLDHIAGRAYVSCSSDSCLVWEIADLCAAPPHYRQPACLEDDAEGESAHTTCRKHLSCLP